MFELTNDYTIPHAMITSGTLCFCIFLAQLLYHLKTKTHHKTAIIIQSSDYAYDKIGYLGTNAPIDHCYKCNFEGDFDPTERGFKCPNCGNTDPKYADVVKRTCGYLGNPQARPMVHGRHKEISSRVKHMNGSAL